MKETKENKNKKKERVRDSLIKDCFGNVGGRLHCQVLTEDMCLYGKCPFYKTKEQFEFERRKYSGSLESAQKVLTHGLCKKVRCITNGKIYMSVSEAAWDNGISVHALSRVLNGKQKTVSGFRFEYA